MIHTDIQTTNNCLYTFKRIFEYKGEIAPIAEKAYLNYRLHAKNEVTRERKLHHFTIGHRFKNIDTERIFKRKLDPLIKDTRPQSFLTLQSFDTKFCNSQIGRAHV